MKRPHLISADELRAMGALDVPPEWRKSMSARMAAKQKKSAPAQRNLFSDLTDDEDDRPAEQAAESHDSDESGTAAD